MAEHPKYRRARAQLVEELYERGIRDERVLRAIGAVPRHLFLEPALRDRAYFDQALPIGLKQTISQPFTVAYQTSMLDVRPGDRVLEIGTGSGYQAAVLCELGARVFSVERHRALLERAKAKLEETGYHIACRHGDGTQGWAAFAPYDGILVTAGAAEVPDALLEQLRVPEPGERGGVLVIPVGGQDGQVMRHVQRTGPDCYEQHETHTFRFVPLVEENESRY